MDISQHCPNCEASVRKIEKLQKALDAEKDVVIEAVLNASELRKRAEKVVEAADEIGGPCVPEEAGRPWCVGHGGARRLPCEYKDLRDAIIAFKGAKKAK